MAKKDKDITFDDVQRRSGIEFRDISGVEYRKYYFRGHTITIERPVALHVSESGGHKLVCASGESVYIDSSFLAISWRPAVKGRSFYRF